MKRRSYREETGSGVMLRSALRIDYIDQLCLSPTERISVIWVDISERPDLAVLAVRSAQESGHAVCTWFSHPPGTRAKVMGLRVAITQSTTAVFTLAFPLERFAGHLVTIAKHEKLWIVPGPPLAHPVGVQQMDLLTCLTQIVEYSGQGALIELESHLVTVVWTQLDEWKRLISPRHARTS